MALSDGDQEVLARAQRMLQLAAEEDIQRAHDVIVLLTSMEATATETEALGTAEAEAAVTAAAPEAEVVAPTAA